VAKHTLIDATNEMGIDLSDPKALDDIYFGAGDIHIPKGRPVLFRIRSRDVTHDVYQPNFRIQMHAVPGMPTKFWFVPTKTTAEMATETGNPDFKYEIVCNQICGRGHFAMRATLVVDEPEDYEKWLAEQKSFAEQNPDLLAKMQQAKNTPVVMAKEKAEPVKEKAAL
jgi:cytochrome c oxidase subunit 2